MKGTCTFLCAFCCYLYGDAGLHELLFESDVFFKGGVQQILTGKDFEKSAQGNRFIVQFKRWCETYGKVIPEDAYQVIGKFNEIFASTTKEIYAEPKMYFLT